MQGFELSNIAIVVGMVVAYIALTTWLTIRYRAKTNSDFNVAARSVPAFIIGVLMMSEFIGAKSTIGVAQTAFEKGAAASWAVLSVAMIDAAITRLFGSGSSFAAARSVQSSDVA